MIRFIKEWAIRFAKSRTIIFNLFVALMGCGEAVFGFLQPHIGAGVYGWGMAILLVGNTILRVLTTTPLSQK